MKKKPTIQDVAMEAGVSKATVSKYLNNTPYVSFKTAKKIEAAIQKLEYQPSSLARSLVNKSTNLIGMVVSNFESMLNMELIKSVETAARELNYNIVLVSTNDNDENEHQLVELLQSKYQHLEGVILANVRKNGQALDRLHNTFEHVVLLHRHLPDSPVDYVVVNGYTGGRLAVEYLISLGHKRMAMICGPQTVYQFYERVRGFKDALKEHGLLEQAFVLETGQSITDGYRAAEKIVFEHNSPTAIFAGSDVLALGVLDAARHYSWDIPGDLSVIGFDNILFSKYARVPLTTVDARINELGKEAVYRLIQRIQGKAKKKSQVQLRPSLVVRESCKKLV